MDKIVAILKPFEIQQHFYVYKNGNRVEEVTTKMQDVCETVVELAKEYNIKKIDFAGPKQFTSGLIDHIKKIEMVKYEINDLDMNTV